MHISRLAVFTSLPLVLGSAAFAGTLNGDPNAYVSLRSTFNENGLKGEIESAEYTYAAFQKEFGGQGYDPTAGEYVYAYQLSLDPGSLPAVSLALPLDIIFFAQMPAGQGYSSEGLTTDGLNVMGADNFGDFALGSGQPPSTEFLSANENPYEFDVVQPYIGFANFTFLPGLAGGQSSSGMAFSSSPIVEGWTALANIGDANGNSAAALVIIPSSTPEPSSIILATLGALALLAYRRRR